MKLIENWRQWPKMYSQWAFITIGALQANVLAFMPPNYLTAPTLFISNMIWGELISGVTVALAVTGFIARLVHQGLSGQVEESP